MFDWVIYILSVIVCCIVGIVAILLGLVVLFVILALSAAVSMAPVMGFIYVARLIYVYFEKRIK